MRKPARTRFHFSDWEIFIVSWQQSPRAFTLASMVLFQQDIST
jgi:hypothetical protein